MSGITEPEESLKSVVASLSCRPDDVVGKGNTSGAVTSTSPCSSVHYSTERSGRSRKWDNSGASPLVCYALRLQPGDEMKSSLVDFASSHGIQVR